MENRHSYSQFAQFPDLVSKHTSLSAMEKSLLGHYILLSRPKIILELGVFEAVTTVFICEFMELNQIEAKVYGFDVPAVVAELRAENPKVRELEAAGKLELQAGFLPDSLIQWKKQHPENFELAIVDAGHTYLNVSQELGLLWERLAPNGYIICDDYSPRFQGICFAVDNFARRRGVMLLPNISAAGAGKIHYASLAVLRKSPYAYTFLDKLRFYSEGFRQWPLIAPLWNLVKSIIGRIANRA